MTIAVKPGFTVAVIGGEFSGGVFALKAREALPQARIVLVERRRKLGRGVAYGACSSSHLLNVPVARMEIGIKPGFQDCLAAQDIDLSAALTECGGNLGAAYVERRLFGLYLEERIEAATTAPSRLSVATGTAMRIEDTPSPTIVLDDGRQLHADIVVLATGNLPPRPLDLGTIGSDIAVVNDPWAEDGLNIDPHSPVLLVGAGLTMVDTVHTLIERGHRGPMLAVSRHGCIPAVHAAGGAWTLFTDVRVSPLRLLRKVRAEIEHADRLGVPWQRVIDALRPAAARIWHGWSLKERRQFLRHLRRPWEAVRHRMAPRAAARLEQAMGSGQLRILAGRIRAAIPGSRGIEITIDRRVGGRERFWAGHIVNCTGPNSDIAPIEYPLLAQLRREGHIVPDPLGLGIETEDCAAIDAFGGASHWLFALGPLTRPAWWEITAVPEINAQIERLIRNLSRIRQGVSVKLPLLADEFLDLGAGI